MELEIIDQDKEEQKIENSESSVNSNPELKEKKVYNLRLSLIIINIISAILGYYIYKNKDYYLSIEYKFEYYYYLLIFVILYSLGMIGALFFSFLLSIVIKICIIITNLFSNDKSNSLTQENESENSINSYSNQFSILSYTFSFFIIFTSLIYLISLPYSIFLLFFMKKNKFYSNYKDFIHLYCFIIINSFAGLILSYVLLIVIFSKRKGSYRKHNFYIDYKKLNNIRNEVKEAMKKAN